MSKSKQCARQKISIYNTITLAQPLPDEGSTTACIKGLVGRAGLGKQGATQAGMQGSAATQQSHVMVLPVRRELKVTAVPTGLGTSPGHHLPIHKHRCEGLEGT